MPKILLSAFSCHPNRGSEPGVGWNWLKELSKKNEIWLLYYDGEGQKEAVMEAVSILPQKDNIHLLPLSVPKFIQNNFYYVRYEIWQKKAYSLVKDLIKNQHFDLIHHVTIAAWWNCGYLWKLNIPFIFGPISGFQMVPLSAIGFLQIPDVMKEMLRNFLVVVGRELHPNFKRAIGKAKVIFCANEATYNYFRKKFRGKEIRLLSEIGVDEALWKKPDNKFKKDSGFTLLWSGAFIPTKNFRLLFDALINLPSDLEWKLIALGDGKRWEFWKKKVNDNKLNDQVVFKGFIEYDEVTNYYENADVFVFPSLREATGTVLLEAMAAGLPPIVLNINGAKNLLNNKSGILIDVDDKKKMTSSFKNAIIELYENPEWRISLGNNAGERAFKYFSWQSRGEYMNDVYEGIVKK